jgi:site-specific DNA recombinase
LNNAGAIVRVSTVKQLDGTSPDKQLAAIQSFAIEQGYSIEPDNIWKLAESGNIIDREGFRNALNAATLGKVSRVYVFNVDRLGRNSLEMMLFLRDIQNSGIECWAAENKKSLRWDDFIFQIEAAVASKERQEIIKRTSDGMERAIKRGQFSGGIIAYGYKYNHETKQLEVDQEEVKVIKMIFSWTIEEHISTVKIAERLNALGIPTRYKKDGRKISYKGKRKEGFTAGIWRAGRVLNMMRNTAYMGVWEWGKRSKKRKQDNRITGYCPAIVSIEEFNKAQEVIHGNRVIQSHEPNRKYILRGLIKCELCGLTYTGVYSRVGKNKVAEKRYYVCNGRHSYKKIGKPKCLNLYLNADEIEKAVWEDVKFYCKNPQVVLHQLKEIYESKNEDVNPKIIEVEKQIQELKRERNNLIELSIKSKEIDTETLDHYLATNKRSLYDITVYKEQLENHKQRQQQIENEIQSVATRLEALSKNIDNANYEEKFRAISELVKNISVNKSVFENKETPIVTITYRFNEPENICPTHTIEENYTPAHAAITVIR